MDKKVYIDKFLSLRYNLPTGSEDKVYAKIKPDGSFQFSFYVLKTQSIYITLGASGYYTMAVVEPGASLNLKLPVRKITQAYEGYPNPHYQPDFTKPFYGKGAEIQNEISRLYESLGKLVVADTIRIDEDKLNTALAEVPALLKTIDQFKTGGANAKPAATAKPSLKAGNADARLMDVPLMLKNTGINNAGNQEINLHDWAVSYLSYKLIAKAIINANNSGKPLDYRKIKFPHSNYQSSEFFYAAERMQDLLPGYVEKEIMKARIMNNPHLVLNAYETELVNKFLENRTDKRDSVELAVIEDRFRKKPKAMDAADSITCSITCNYYKATLPPELSDIAIGNTIKGYYLSPFIKAEAPQLLKKINNPAVAAYVKANVLRAKTPANISYTKATESDMIKLLVKKYPGKGIYIDLWATWCAPCRDEFTYYPQLIDKFGDKVAFVFLCNRSPEQTFKEIIAKLPFKAEHYFLNTEQNATLFKEFNVSGIPHYIFITKEGKIINKFKRPSSTENLYRDIEAEM
ncbi:hypothetical protein GCM10023149_19680 [Mucilaginibacter gynuensis]|uniref:Thioredoxin domain-containing protein n=1 Tax=Mucilaginibacter gynuensis TaxID=1302236 RepID=A0ABP8GA24_9SPHI